MPAKIQTVEIEEPNSGNRDASQLFSMHQVVNEVAAVDQDIEDHTLAARVEYSI